MPIKGLTDRGLALPEIGQIRKGAKKEPNRPGADLTYFRVEFDESELGFDRNGNPKAYETFKKYYGDKPNAIRIILPFNEIERMWDAWKEAYTAGRMVARSDGEYLTYLLNEHGDIIVHNGMDSESRKVPHPKDDIAGMDSKGNPVKFKNTARLKVIVPELARAAYLTVMTTSTHDIGNLSDQLAGFKELNGGQLAGIPFVLRRRPKMISTPTPNGTRVRRKKFLISIEADENWVRAKLTQIQSIALPQFEGTLLPVGELEDAPIEYDEDEIEGETQEEGINNPIDEPLLAIEIIDTLSDWAVTEAAKCWNVTKHDAAKEIGKAKLGKMDKREFSEWLKAPK